MKMVNYETWVAEAPDSLKNDPIWKFAAYPKSLWLFDLVWQDCERLKEKVQGKALINQLVRSADSVSANIDEGYGHGIERQQYAYYLRTALGSARETRSRYFKGRHLLPEKVTEHRMKLCDEIIALLVVTIKNHRPHPKR